MSWRRRRVSGPAVPEPSESEEFEPEPYDETGGPVPVLSIECLDGPSCMVHIEPWGSEHVLREGEVFTLQTLALANGRVGIAYLESGISVWITDDSPVTLTDRAGNVLPI